VRHLLVFVLLLSPRAWAGDPCRLGAEALSRQNLSAAETYLKQCLDARPEQIFPYLQLCAVYQLQGNAEALHRIALEGLKRFPGEKRFYLTVGNRAGQDGRYERAVEIFSEGFRRWPDDARFRKGLAGAEVSLGMEILNGGNNQLAEEHLRRATELDPEDVEAHLNRGRALHNLNRSVEALAEFDKVLALNRNLTLARFHRGMVRYELGEYDAAIEDLRREIESNPEYPPSYLFRGLALIAKGEWARALPDLDIAARRMPENVRAQYGRARCLRQLGKNREAEEGLRKTMELDPSDPSPVNALARLLLETGRAEEAQQMFQKSAELSKKQRSAAPGEIRYQSAKP
jgi:tetratricopeptide (TPR) repeat protein